MAAPLATNRPPALTTPVSDAPLWTAENGTRLARLRADRGETQAAVGRAVGTDGQLVSKWERATGGPPSTTFLRALAKHFGVTMEYLLSGHSTAAEAVVERDPEEVNPEIAKLRTMFPAGGEPTADEIAWLAGHVAFHNATALGMAQAILGMRHGMSPEQARAAAQETARFRDSSVPPKRPKGAK